MSPDKVFAEAWKEGSITKPTVVLIGGYAGTGKSTLAASLSQNIGYTQITPTGIIRSIAQTQTTPQENPALFMSTYDLHTLYGSSTEQIATAFKEQCTPITNSINSLLSFLATEKQHLIIEGNHILPWERYSHPDCNIIELYLYVDDADQHRAMLGGPTHNRTIDSEQFRTARKIHDMLHTEVTNHNKALFECGETDRAREFFLKKLSSILETSL